MKEEPGNENPDMLQRMAGENETLRGQVMALIITLLCKAMGLGKAGMNATRKHHGFTAKDALGVLEAGRMGALMDIGLNKTNLSDMVFHVQDSGIDKLVVIDDGQVVREMLIGASSHVDKVLMSRNGKRAIGALMALRRVKHLDAVRLEAMRRQLATDTEEIEEGYAPANAAVRAAFGLSPESTVRYVALEDSLLSTGDLRTKQGLQQYATQAHLNLNADTVVQWFKNCVDANAYYCAACSKNHMRGTRDNGRPVPVNWSAPAVLGRTVSLKVATRWGISEDKTGTRRCPTCDTPAWALSHNGNTAHLPLLTFNGKTCEGVKTTDFGAVRAVSFRMDKESFKVVQRAAQDMATPTDAIRALMGAKVDYRVRGKVFNMGRLVPVWFHHQGDNGAHLDRLGLAIEPVFHAGGENGDINA